MKVGMTVESIHRMKIAMQIILPLRRYRRKTVMDALKERQFDQIYLLFGANELG
ncbi:MAG: hypothetical protein ACLR13_04690 [Acutalibacteraceae bacterium]